MKMTENDLANKRIGFVGFGQMARALWGGFSRLGLRGVASDPFPSLTEGIQFVSINEVFTQSDIVFLCVKPQVFRSMVFPEARQPVVSIMAGIRLQEMARHFTTVIRLMPNTPMAVLEGMTAVCYPPDSSAIPFLETLLMTCGRVLRVEESWMDGVTALSGSGPAFLYRLAQLVQSWGEEHGLPESISLELVAQTLVGAGKMLLQTPNPSLLIQQVSSPNGTTMAGLQVADDRGFDAIWRAIFDAAEQRSKELSV